MNYLQILKIPTATIIYSSLGKKLRINTKPTTIKKIKPKFVIDLKKDIFFPKNKNIIKEIKSYNLILESTKISHYAIEKIFIEIKAKIAIYYLNKYLKNKIFIREIVIHKIINTAQKNIKFSPIIRINSLDIVDNSYIIANISLYLL